MRARVTKRRALTGLALVSVAVVALASTGAAGGSEPEPLPFAETQVRIEVNSTDGDAGLHFFADGEPWRSVTVAGPDGDKLANLKAKDKFRDFGLTELFSESNEPPFDELPLEDFLRRFPEGEYTFAGTTIDGRKMVGSDRPATSYLTARQSSLLTMAPPSTPRAIWPSTGSP